MKCKYLLVAIIFVTVLLFTGCTSNENQTDNGIDDSNGDVSDLCGNAIGNGDEIVFGQVTPTD